MRGSVWGSAVALASVIRGDFISQINTGDREHLVPVVPDLECMKASRGLM